MLWQIIGWIIQTALKKTGRGGRPIFKHNLQDNQSDNEKGSDEKDWELRYKIGHVENNGKSAIKGSGAYTLMLRVWVTNREKLKFEYMRAGLIAITES